MLILPTTRILHTINLFSPYMKKSKKTVNRLAMIAAKKITLITLKGKRFGKFMSLNRKLTYSLRLKLLSK